MMASLLAIVVATFVGRAEAQPPTCKQRLEVVTVCQRCYVELRAGFLPGQVYLWAPDIKTGFFGNRFDPFQLWVVEGVYGRPFSGSTGPLDESNFNRIRNSQNIIATPIIVDWQTAATPKIFKIGKGAFVLRIDKVNRSFGGTDSVTVSICR